MIETSNFVVLVVDDNLASRRLPRLILNPLGVKVIECGSGSQALALLETHHISHILLDISMPDMSGTEIAIHIQKACLERYKPKIIAYTADASLLNTASAACFDHVLIKPIHAHDLLHIFKL